ncbi:MAG TPA: hypothetical protein VFA10_27115 [Ktedonobacteraceae bacterium]|nr:hypothetical protein [Ktedonobacteraceae bacterium]
MRSEESKPAIQVGLVEEVSEMAREYQELLSRQETLGVFATPEDAYQADLIEEWMARMGYFWIEDQWKKIGVSCSGARRGDSTN